MKWLGTAEVAVEEDGMVDVEEAVEVAVAATRALMLHRWVETAVGEK